MYTFMVSEGYSAWQGLGLNKYASGYSAVWLIMGTQRTPNCFIHLDGHSVQDLRTMILTHGNIISVWISNHMLHEVWNDITYPFPNFNGCTVEIWQFISDFTSNFICTLLFFHVVIKVDPCPPHPEQQWPLLLTWFNFNPSMDKWLYPL